MKLKLFLTCLILSVSGLKAQNYLLQFKCSDDDSTAIDDVASKIIGKDSTDFVLNKYSYSLKPGIYTLVLYKFGYHEKREVLVINNNIAPTIVLQAKPIEQSNFIVKATRVQQNNAFAYTNVSARELSLQNLGQDFTYLIGNTASAVTTSDAGTGIGYTGIRIRGSDATRINVTINGIPINDAESHGVYWVNMPDLASSTNNVQIQRGVGTSTNGNGSFGANISIDNIENSSVPGLQLQQSYGSFNTFKSNLKFSTGRLGNFSFSGRLSKITSDGYIDRASSNLSAFQFNLNYYYKRWAVNAVSFGGKEKTYQSWYGTPQSRFENDNEGMMAYSGRNYLSAQQQDNLLNSGRTYNYYTYKNQTDNYWQNHYQLHIGRELGKNWAVKSSFFTTTGKGYYEEYKTDASFSNYGVSDYISPKGDTISTTDLVRQKWLDNIYYGNFTTLDYEKNNLKINSGIGITRYEGKHFGKVIWANTAAPFGGNTEYEYYSATSIKQEVNAFSKVDYKPMDKLNVMAEIQVRQINYSSKGINSDVLPYNYDQDYTFINPKAGVNYIFNRHHQAYASYSIGNREPVRGDFIDNNPTDLPQPENMQDIELGWIKKHRYHFIQVNGYYMIYKNQLVLTGALNDVGSPLRTNVAESYRMGIELIGMKSFFNGKTVFDGNLTLSNNRIESFTDVYLDYDNNVEIREIHENTNISFSPSVIGYIGVTDKHIKNLQLGLNLKYVGKQYLDNTQNSLSSIKGYTTLNFNFQKEFKIKNMKTFVIKGAVNNLGSINYTNNGYTYKYVYGNQLTTENFYYPQSLRNFLLGIDVKF
ncbi:MAG: TonB-dependent receptor [Bacteroidota bacterium]